MANNLTRFDPFGDIGRFDPFRSVDDMFRDFSLRPGSREMSVEPRIKMDVTETDEAYTVKAEIPGVRKEDIKIDVDGNQVSISAELKQETEERKGKTLRTERYYGMQSRNFTLAHDIDDGKVEARYADGVLQLLLPKKAGKSGKHITVS